MVFLIKGICQLFVFYSFFFIFFTFSEVGKNTHAFAHTYRKIHKLYKLKYKENTSSCLNDTVHQTLLHIYYI